MSEINANIVVEPINLTISQIDPGITITPEALNLNVFTGGYACAQGNTNEVQYNAGGFIAGNPNLLFYASNGTTVANIIKVTTSANLGNVGNVIIIGGSANYLLQTDGNGNLNWANYQSVANANYANFAGEVVDASQPNITSLGTLISLDVTGNITGGNANLGNAVTANYFIGNGALLSGIDTSQIANGNSNVKVFANANVAISSTGNANILVASGTGVEITGTLNVTGDSTLANVTSNANIAFTGPNVSLGNVANLEITGGNNGQYLQTDGTGNLTWAAGGGSGNGVVGGSNTQIQYNDAGLFGGSVGFTFDKTTNAMAAPGNIIVSGTVIGNVQGPIVNLAYGVENVSLIGAQSGTYNFDFISNSIRFPTADATSNVTLNFRGNSTVSANTLLANGQSVTCTYVLKTGSTPYYVTAVQVDGANQTINYVNGTTPTVFNNSYTSYTFTIIKNSTTPTYVVLGSGTRYA
jgi:hypothetical protein